jgi:LysM repeat protein
VMALRALNPELLTGITPPDADDYSIKLPEWVDKAKFREDLKTALEGEDQVQEIITYTCKKRDTLTAVMKMHKVTYKDLLLVNSCDQTLVAKQGSVIYIPRFSRETEPAETEPAPLVQEPAPIAKKESRPENPERGRLARVNGLKVTRLASKITADARNDFHIVKKGEKLADISEMYGIDLARLKEINKLKKNQIYPNMRLELTASRVKKKEKPIRPAVYRTSRSKKGGTLSGTAEKYDAGARSLKEKDHPKKKAKAQVRPVAKPRAKAGKATRVARG